MLEVREADFARDGEEMRRVRFDVFVREQKVPEEVEMDERDPVCVHVLARLGGAAVGTGRLDVGAGGKIGRVAVLSGERGRGVGTAIMLALHAVARRRGLDSVWCNAQVAAVPFYRRLGYWPVGEEFDEAGIAHVRMEAALEPDHRVGE